MIVAGTTIPQGTLVLGVIASANRDEACLADPDRLDLGREDNGHLAFGQGIHYCVGAPPSRLEGQIAINALIARATTATGRPGGGAALPVQF